MKKLPISIQTFSEIRRRDLIYVDKTKLIYELAKDGKYYFFARPQKIIFKSVIHQ